MPDNWVNPMQPRNADSYYGFQFGDQAGGSFIQYDPVDGLVISSATGKVTINSAGVNIDGASLVFRNDDGSVVVASMGYYSGTPWTQAPGALVIAEPAAVGPYAGVEVQVGADQTARWADFSIGFIPGSDVHGSWTVGYGVSFAGIAIDYLYGIASALVAITGDTTVTGELATSGSLTFTGSAKRIKGDFTNATRANRLMFQTSTAASATNVGVLPSANTNIAQVTMFDQTDPDNSHNFAFQITPASTRCSLVSNILGTATTIWPISFVMGTTEVARMTNAGDLIFLSAGSGLAYGSCWGLEIAQVQASAVQNTWYAVNDTDMTDGELNEVAHDGSGKLTVTYAGKYMITYSVTLEANAANKHLLCGIGINGSVQSAGQSHAESLTSQEFVLAGTAIVTLTASQYIQIFFRTTDTGTPNITVDDVGISIVQVGA